MRNSRGFLVILLMVAAILSGAYWFRSEWRMKLTSKEGRMTIAHVYSTYKVKGNRYFSYIYKVGTNYYSAATSGSNVAHQGDTMNLQYFLLSYYNLDPKIHTVIWSSNISTPVPLGVQLDSMNLDKKLIKKHTSIWNGVSPTARENDVRDIRVYKKKMAL